MDEIVVTSAPGRESFRMRPEVIALALGLKYAFLVVYGIHAALVEVPSFVEVGGRTFALGWALTVSGLAAVALAGVIHTWRTNQKRVEKFTTAILILTFLAYSIVLLIRGATTDNWSSTPLFWLPFILTIFPIIRYYTLVVQMKAER